MEVAPRHDGHDGHERAHVEDEDAHDQLVDGLRQHFARVLGFGYGHTYEFDELVGEEHHLEAHEEVHPAVRRKLEAVGNVRKAHSGTGNRAVHAFDMRGRVAETEEQHHHGGDNQTHNQCDFDHGEPEFRLAEHFHGNEIDAGERHKEAQFDKPFPRVEVYAERTEERDEIRADGCDFGHAGQDEHDPVRPAGEFAPRAAEVAGDEVDEGVLAWVAVHHFADGAHEQEHDEAHADVHEDDARSGQRDRLAGAEEQAGADGAADGDELDVAVFQAAFHVVIFVEAFDGFDLRGFRRFGRACTSFSGFRIPKSHNVHTLPRQPHNLRRCSHREMRYMWQIRIFSKKRFATGGVSLPRFSACHGAIRFRVPARRCAEPVV